MTVFFFKILIGGGTFLPVEDGFEGNQKSFGLKSEDYNW